ncbi:MAG: hypothetical protein L0Y72_06535 [Gemmataceae bacterium]|nr:hypothetical protein [Gemmataceae bacterium]MCI0738683.1 hypothetical protein [Gemmataceae bacterium]
MNRDRLKALAASMRRDLPTALLASYLMGARIADVAQGIGSSKPSRKQKQQWAKAADILIAIANGDETLVHSGADIRRLKPDARDIEFTRKHSQEFMQAIAKLIVMKLDHD